MKSFSVLFQPANVGAEVTGGTVLEAQIKAGLRPDAPCGGKGTCGKCRVTLEDGSQVLACQTIVSRDMVVNCQESGAAQILASTAPKTYTCDGENPYALAFDVGTTTVVAYLMNGQTGQCLARASCLNPQRQYGADVISRIQAVLTEGGNAMSDCIREALAELTSQVCQKAYIQPKEITVFAVAGNTAMHHLLLNIDPRPLVTPPYMPAVTEALELGDTRNVRVLPNIAGYVGGDTVGCMLAADFDHLEELTLMIDIGTNGEMVLGNKTRRVTCSTAAGPAFEGAKISCGMRGTLGAVDHVWMESGTPRWHVLGDGQAKGLCGSGLLDLVSVLLALDVIDDSGYMTGERFRLGGTSVVLTQKDVREVQLAKAAIRAGIELLAKTMNVSIQDIQRVYLAGAFGNYLSPSSACRIGMIPPELEHKITPIGNAAGVGAVMCALNHAEFERGKRMAIETEFLELASLPEFQDCYVDALSFSEDE